MSENNESDYETAVVQIMRAMRSNGLYLSDDESKLRSRNMKIYTLGQGGLSRTALMEQFNISSSIIDVVFKKVRAELKNIQEALRHPDEVCFSPLPVRIKLGLENLGITTFSALHNKAIKELLKQPNLGKGSLIILDAFLRKKHPEIILEGRPAANTDLGEQWQVLVIGASSAKIFTSHSKAVAYGREAIRHYPLVKGYEVKRLS